MDYTRGAVAVKDTIMQKVYLTFFIIFQSALLMLAGCAELRPIPDGVVPVEVQGEIVQANTRLFRSGMKSNDPAQIVFSLDLETSSRDLEKAARMAFSLKGTMPRDPDKALIAREVTNENYRPNVFVKIPAHLISYRKIYMTHVWIEREKLSYGHIREDRALIFHVYLVDGEPYTIRLIGD